MDGKKLVIEHFNLMGKVAAGLRKVDAQIQEHHYTYSAFGSWWTSIAIGDQLFRIIYDARDEWLSIERALDPPVGYRWDQTPVASRAVGDEDVEAVIREMLMGLV